MMAPDRDQQRRLLAKAAGRQHLPAHLRIAEFGREIGPRHAERRDFDILQPEAGETRSPSTGLVTIAAS